MITNYYEAVTFVLPRPQNAERPNLQKSNLAVDSLRSANYVVGIFRARLTIEVLLEKSVEGVVPFFAAREQRTVR